MVTCEKKNLVSAGILALADFVRNDRKIKVMKLWANKREIATKTTQTMCEAVKENETLMKMVMQCRFKQHRDAIDRYVLRNREKIRRSRLLQTAMQPPQ